MTKESFTKWVHNFGMGSSAILLILMSSFPIVISMVYGVWPDFKMIIPVSDGKLMETQTANYFSDIYPIDCAVLSANA